MKNQLKKSLSLLMAVLMILSCWVWVAPEKASAAVYTGYDVRYIIWDGGDGCGGNGCPNIMLSYKGDNGTGGNQQTKTYTLTDAERDQLEAANNYVYHVFSNVGFPDSVACTYSIGTGYKPDWYHKLQVRKHGGTDSDWVDVTGNELIISAGYGDKSGTVTANVTQNRPFLNTAKAKLSESVVNLSKFGGSDVTSTISLIDLADQYGVTYTAAVNPSFSVNSSDAEGNPLDLTGYVSVSGSGSSRTISVKPIFQTLFPSSKTSTLYVDWSVNDGALSGTETLTLNHPQYTAYFYPNGGIIGTSSTNNVTDKPLEIGKLYYGDEIGDIPPYAKKDGMTFDGYYNVQNGDLTGLTGYFKGEKFNANNTWTRVTETGDTHWYAAWKSTELTATFIVNGQFLGTLPARYDNSMLGKYVEGVRNMYVSESAINQILADGYDGDAITFDGNNNPTLKVGSTELVFNGWKIVEYDDASLVNTGNLETILTGDVIFGAQFVPRTDVAEKKYTVKFFNSDGEVISEKSNYKYRDSITLPSYPPTKSEDKQFTYDFIGWAVKAGDNGNNYYAIDENGCDIDGAYISYTSVDSAEFIVTNDIEYVPVFRMIPREYKVTFKTLGDGAIEARNVEVDGYHYGDSITVPEEIKDNYTQAGRRYFINGWKVGKSTAVNSIEDITVTGDMTLTASYDNTGILAEYNIRFFDMYGNLIGAEYDDEGKLTNEKDFIYQHNTTVTPPTVGDVKDGDSTTYDIPFTIDTEDSLYTFKGWSPAVNTTATADVDYKADYLQKDYADVYFYNYDGTLLYKLDGKENGNFVGDVIPAYSYALPERKEDPSATYAFANTWMDSNGNVVKPGEDKFEGDVYLTAQYNKTDKFYTVEFLNGDEVISRQKLKYGEPVTIPANPTQDADALYSYSFWKWSSAVSEICYGDATYNAIYKRSAIYYDIIWLADNKKTEVRHSMYAYGARIQQANAPETPITYGAAEQGFSWAFKEWVRCDEYGNLLDAEGNIVNNVADALRFERGMTMPQEKLYFYPVYEQVATKYEVEFYAEDGTTLLAKAMIPNNGAIEDYSGDFVDLAVKQSDENYHYDFSKWVKLDGSELTMNGDKYIITEATKVKASYTSGSHEFKEYETVVAPTCTETGLVKMKCKSEYCTLPSYEKTVDVIPDDVAPTAQVYMGSNKWTMSDFINNNIDYSKKIYVGANSATIVNAEDLNTRTGPWNNEGSISRGVGKIEYYISDKVISNPATQISEWTTIYNYNNVYNEVLESVLSLNDKSLSDYETLNEQLKAEIDSEVKAILATYKANATGILGELGLENGKEYIIYFRISDRAVEDDVNISYMSTGKLHYGTQAATITVSGNGYGSKFCADARIAIADDTDGFEIYLDDEKLNISATATSVTGSSSTSFVCDEIGVHTITVIDKNGNRSSKTFEIKGGHTFRNYTVAASCENDGSRYDLCTVCGIKANVQTLTKLGHNYKTYTEKAPTCTVYGSRTYVCDNNCGEKLVVSYNTDTSAWVNLAEAKLKAEDVKHLEATGEHTYPMVIGADGKETTEEAWVIDKAATCMVAGSKHRDCTKCGYRETVTINIDPDAHKYYRARVEDDNKPTCTEQGKKTETCRYCGYENFVEYVAALGHTAGKYKVTTEATCETEGSKILTCAVCKDADGKPTVIGEPVEDADGNVTFNGQAVVIPATGHAYKAVNDPVYNETDGKWYQHYVCNNDANHTKDEETEHEEKVSATVTFVSESTTVGTFTKYVGETIVAADVTAPTKAADETYKYTFSHWEDESGKEVSFPITVAEEGATYTAVFAKKNVKYTVTYLNENGTQYKKVGYLNNLTEVKLEKGPAKAETVYKEFAFAGWAMDVEVENEGVTETQRQVVESVTIDGANVTLYATYTETDRHYGVTYAYTLTDQIESFSVQAGLPARDCGLVPEKAADSKYHYTFSGWNRANQLAAVTSNIYTTPNFTAVAHDLKVDADSVVPATCTSNRIEKKVCACGYETAAAEVKNTMLGHNWSENAEYDATSGKYIRKCQNQGCTATTADTRTFTLSFYYETPANETVKPNREVNNIAWGTSVDASRLPAAPEKDADDQYIYTFKGWKLKGAADDKLEDITKLVIKQDYEFVAVFDKAEREYTVTFAYEYSHKPIESYTVKYGMGKNFTGADPEKKNDTDPNYDPENYHYTFSGWSEKTDRITKDTVVYAKFTKAEHTYGDPVETGPATCQQGTGYKYTCTLSTCKHEKFETGKPLDHNLEIIESVAATPDKDGYIIKQCTYVYDGKRCEYTEKEDVKYEDSTIKVVVTVDRDGAPASGIKVITHAVGEDTMMNATTNAYGVATIVVAKDKSYVAYVVIDGKEILVPLSTDAKGNFVGAYSIVTNNNNNSGDADCGCACHRDNFWGSIFRFFHKIIKLFTGEFKCCGNPDPMYG